MTGFGIKVVNYRVICGGFLLLAVITFSVYVKDLLFIYRRPEKLPNSFAQADIFEGLPELSALSPLSDYQGIIVNRNIFNLQTNEESVVSGIRIEDLIRDLRLRGIVELDGKQAIIEDARTQKSDFIEEGGSINGLTIKRILDEAVIVTDGVREVEMKIAGK